jgi:hypothetical protein
MRLDLPDPGAGPHAGALRQAFEALRRSFLPLLSTQEAAPFLLLRSPDGGIWRVAVGDDGGLSAEKVQG